MADHHHHHHHRSEDTRQDERVLNEQLDAAGKSLTQALHVSFTILKGIIVVLLIVFACSGIFQVQPDEQALLLQFGKIKPATEENPVFKPGIQFALPEPIDEVIRIPVTRELSIPIESFWYYETPQEKLNPNKQPVSGPLDPLIDGYCLTRNDSLEGLTGTDYNIVHSQWTVTYKINSPRLFFENVYIRDRQPGEDLLEAASDTLKPLLESLASNAIVRTMVKYSIDDAIKSEAKIALDVKTILQDKLNQIQCGIEVGDVRSGRIIWPRQVDEAFQSSSKARQERDQARIDALSYKDKLLTDTGGADAEKILEELQQPGLSQEQQKEKVMKLSGQVQASISEARLYQTKVVEDAKANAEYMKKILPEYEKNPELVLQDIYQKAIEQVMDGADEKIFIQTREGLPDELRFMINRNPNIKQDKQNSNTN